MIRLMGTLTGIALGIAVLILAFGLPNLTPPQGEAVDETFTEPVVEAPAEPTVDTISEPVAEPADDPPVEPADDPPVEPVVEAAEVEPPPRAVQPEPVEPLHQEQPVAPRPVAESEAPGELVQLLPQPDSAENWYAFWSPFRSRIAADGFVAELQRTTGLDYRVVKLKPGIYEVAFAYSDDADIEDKLNRIAAATGMDMSGG